MTEDGARGDTWTAGRATTLTLLAATLIYLVIEAAFNSRLLDVLGATRIDETHSLAISGLERWGRTLSAIAVGLALACSYVVQAQKGQEPEPIALLSRLRGSPKEPSPWKIWHYVFSSVIVLAAMFIVFNGERSWVEAKAENASVEDRWWMFYAARGADGALIGADRFEDYLDEDAQRRQRPTAAEPTETYESEDPEVAARAAAEAAAQRYPHFQALYLDDLQTFALGRFETADWRTLIAIAPHASQNFARTERVQQENQEEPLTPRDIERQIEEGVANQSTAMVEGLTTPTVFGPVSACLAFIYDQSQAPVGDGFDPSICVTQSGSIADVRSQHPDFFASAPSYCLQNANGNEKPFVDFSTIRCVYLANADRFSIASAAAARSYVSAYQSARRAALNEYRAAPGRLPEAEASRLLDAVNRTLRDNGDLRASGALESVTISQSANLPACGQFGEDRLSAFRSARNAMRDAVDGRVAVFLRDLDRRYCATIDGMLSEGPTPASTAALGERANEVRRAASAALQTALDGQNVPRAVLGGDWPLRTGAEFQAFAYDRLVAPIDSAARQIIGAQLHASDEEVSRLPHPAVVQSLDEFKSNPVVSALFMRMVHDLTDSVFGCLGLEGLQGRAAIPGEFSTLMAPEGSRAYSQSVGQLLFANVFQTRLTGSLDDFAPGARCYAAGVSAYHRGFIPGFALFISLLGLIYHSRKAVLYVLRLTPMATSVRHVVAGAATLVLIATPFALQAPALQTDETDRLIARYESTHGAPFETGARWLVQAQTLYHPITSGAYAWFFAPFDIDFATQPNRDALNFDMAHIDRACGRVPQIRQTREYQILREVITHRDLCEAPATLPPISGQ